jgi:hypothetical protein
MTLVSLDVIVQADATLIVGIVFIVTLKQALKQKVTRNDLTLVAAAILSYVLSGIAAVFPDLLSSLDSIIGYPATVAPWLVMVFGFGSIFLFYLGMALTAGAVYRMMSR